MPYPSANLTLHHVVNCPPNVGQPNDSPAIRDHRSWLTSYGRAGIRQVRKTFPEISILALADAFGTHPAAVNKVLANEYDNSPDDLRFDRRKLKKGFLARLNLLRYAVDAEEALLPKKVEDHKMSGDNDDEDEEDEDDEDDEEEDDYRPASPTARARSRQAVKAPLSSASLKPPSVPIRQTRSTSCVSASGNQTPAKRSCPPHSTKGAPPAKKRRLETLDTIHVVKTEEPSDLKTIIAFFKKLDYCPQDLAHALVSSGLGVAELARMHNWTTKKIVVFLKDVAPEDYRQQHAAKLEMLATLIASADAEAWKVLQA